MLLTFESVDKIIKCAHSNKHYFLSSTRLYLLMSASSQKLLSKNQPKEKKREKKSHPNLHLSFSRSKEKEQLYGLAISLNASSKRKNDSVRVLDSFGRIK